MQRSGCSVLETKHLPVSRQKILPRLREIIRSTTPLAGHHSGTCSKKGKGTPQHQIEMSSIIQEKGSEALCCEAEVTGLIPQRLSSHLSGPHCWLTHDFTWRLFVSMLGCHPCVIPVSTEWFVVFNTFQFLCEPHSFDWTEASPETQSRSPCRFSFQCFVSSSFRLTLLSQAVAAVVSLRMT